MADTYFHIGVVVDDLPAAIEKYSRVLGLTFTEPAHVHVPRLEDPVPHEHLVYVAFSKDGPPYYELIEAAGDGIFSKRFANQILYLGMWETDMAGRIAALEAEGIGLEEHKISQFARSDRAERIRCAEELRRRERCRAENLERCHPAAREENKLLVQPEPWRAVA